jgi:tetratricopeptide (TPR) repeat protein/tRNA A-37 threonylcarbamoyl transferase component Bud32
MSDLTGQTIDRYEIVELIDEGGMATVYRARQTRLQRDVAIKVMLPELAADPTFRERFEREAQAIANLRHPNILTVYDYGETADGQLYLVVDYVRRGTLRDRLEAPPSIPPAGGEAGGVLSLQETVEIVAQVAEALDYAHQQGVIHRDVKPNNVLLTREGRPLLADFGLVKPIKGDRRLTASGIMLGTPDYVAPEQAQALEIDGRADIYALGVMLFEMLTGRHPYEGETPVSIIIKHITEPMPHPSQFNAAVPRALDEIVAKATAKDPSQRYQRAGEMARELRAVLVSGTVLQPEVESAAPLPTPPDVPSARLPAAEESATAAAAEPAPVPRPWYRQTRVGAALAAVLAVAAAVLILPFLSSGERGAEEAGAVPMARPGEVMILIAQFKAQAGSEHYDVSQRIYDKLSADLRRLEEEEVSVYQVPEVVESSAAATALGQRYGATTVIWGFYDDIGISPNIEAVGTLEDNPMSVGLERFNLDADEAFNFRLYIAKDLPEELSFLTSVSLVQAFMLQGRMEKVMSYTVMAAENLPTDPQFRGGGETIFFIQGIIAFFRGDLETALDQMNQAIAINPDKAFFYIVRGGVLLQLGEGEQALAEMERAVGLEPDNATAYTMQGNVAWFVGDLDAALSAFERFIELEPDEWLGYLGRSILRFEAGELSSSLEDLNRVEAINPDSEYLPVARGLVYEKSGQTELAAADYARAREVSVGSDPLGQFMQIAFSQQMRIPIPAYFHLTDCASYQARGNLEEAFEGCNRALEADPTYVDALWKRGQLYAAQGDWESAVDDYTAAIEADPSWPWFYFLRAQALIELNRTGEARADLARALELNPVDGLRQQIEELRASTE